MFPGVGMLKKTKYTFKKKMNKGPYIYNFNSWGWGVIEVCHLFAGSIAFKQYSYCSFFVDRIWPVGVGH